MTAEVKICGLTTQECVDVAVEHEADYLGFVFFPPSPRFVTPKDAAKLVSTVPELVVTTGLVVDATDQMLELITKTVPLGMLQLHGNETPDRVKEIRDKFELPVCKALSIATKEDMRTALEYEAIVDMLLFDAKPPKSENALPGGNGVPFDWSLLQDADLEAAWMLSGGLTPQTVIGAIELTGAEAVDVSSGVENKRGEKDPDLIAAFLDIVRGHGADPDEGYVEI